MASIATGEDDPVSKLDVTFARQMLLSIDVIFAFPIMSELPANLFNLDRSNIPRALVATAVVSDVFRIAGAVSPCSDPIVSTRAFACSSESHLGKDVVFTLGDIVKFVTKLVEICRRHVTRARRPRGTIVRDILAIYGAVGECQEPTLLYFIGESTFSLEAICIRVSLVVWVCKRVWMWSSVLW